MNEIETTTEKLLRLNQILEIVPLGRSTLWKMVAEDRFPHPVKLSERCTAWRESEIQQWMKDLSSNGIVNSCPGKNN